MVPDCNTDGGQAGPLDVQSPEGYWSPESYPRLKPARLLSVPAPEVFHFDIVTLFAPAPVPQNYPASIDIPLEQLRILIVWLPFTSDLGIPLEYRDIEYPCHVVVNTGGDTCTWHYPLDVTSNMRCRIISAMYHMARMLEVPIFAGYRQGNSTLQGKDIQYCIVKIIRCRRARIMHRRDYATLHGEDCENYTSPHCKN
jgi:hypothetical protein